MIVSSLIFKLKNRRKNKVTLRLQSNNKKFCTVRFNDDEMKKIKTAAQYEKISIEQLFVNSLKQIGTTDNDQVSSNS
jgi:hypothetical protein